MTGVKHVKALDVEAKPVDSGVGVTVRWLISVADGSDNCAMRLFEVQPGGHTAYHSHPFEHLVYVVQGKGLLLLEDREVHFEAGDVLYVPPNVWHSFVNDGDEVLRFLCIIPVLYATGRKQAGIKALRSKGETEEECRVFI